MQPPELGFRVVPEGGRRPFGQKQTAMIQQFLSQRGTDEILVLVQTENLNGIRVAVQQQSHHFSFGRGSAGHTMHWDE